MNQIMGEDKKTLFEEIEANGGSRKVFGKLKERFEKKSKKHSENADTFTSVQFDLYV